MRLHLQRWHATSLLLAILVGSVALVIVLDHLNRGIDEWAGLWCLIGANVFAASLVAPALFRPALAARIVVSIILCGSAVAVVALVDTLYLVEQGMQFKGGEGLGSAVMNAWFGFLLGGLFGGCVATMIAAFVHMVTPPTSAGQ